MNTQLDQMSFNTLPNKLDSRFSDLLLQHYQPVEVLGNGVEGVVYKGHSKKRTNEQVAIKLYKSGIKVSEKELLEKLKGNELYCQNLVKIKEIFQGKDQSDQIVMELADGNLQDYFKEKEYQDMAQEQRNLLFYQIVVGIETLHNFQVFHRDLKPLNILYLRKKWNRQNLTLKICDYGFVKKISDQNSDQKRLTMNVGTLCYRPKEQSTDCYDKSVDIWALGVIWCQMLGIVTYSQLSFQNQQSKVDKLIEDSNTSWERVILKKILRISPDERLTIAQLKWELIKIILPRPFDNITSTRNGWIQINIKEKLVEGKEYIIYKGKIISKNKSVAIQVQNSISQYQREFFEKMIERTFHNVFNILDLITQPERVAVVMDYDLDDFCSNDLLSEMNRSVFKEMQQNEINQLFYQIVKGVAELKKYTLTHRNLKPKDIVYFQKDRQAILKIRVLPLDLQYNETQMKISYYSTLEIIGHQMGQFSKTCDIGEKNIIRYSNQKYLRFVFNNLSKI